MCKKENQFSNFLLSAIEMVVQSVLAEHAKALGLKD